MLRFAPAFFGLAVIAVWIWCLIDVITTDQMLMRNLPKATWLMIVLILPGVGGIVWLASGRPANAGWSPGATHTRPPRRPPQRRVRGPEDRDDWGR